MVGPNGGSKQTAVGGGQWGMKLGGKQGEINNRGMQIGVLHFCYLSHIVLAHVKLWQV